jgi:hypothetical protein
MRYSDPDKHCSVVTIGTTNPIRMEGNMDNLEQGQISRCDKFITQYEGWQQKAKLWYHFFKVVAYASVAVAPLVVVI